MNCEEALTLLSGSLDRSNTDEETARLQAHLSQCPSCRALLEDLKALDQGLLDLKEEPPADLCEAVMASIARESAARKPRRRAWTACAAAAALALCIGAGALAMPRAEKTDQAPAARMAREEPELAAAPQAATAYAAEPQTFDAEVGLMLTAAPAPEENAQALAVERRAPVALVYGILPELDSCPCETLEDGSLLYTLPDPAAAADLCEAHPAEAQLFRPETADGEASYALVIP